MAQAFTYQQRLEQLKQHINSSQTKKNIRIEKGTTSNLFRYQGQKLKRATKLPLKEFNHVLTINKENLTLEVEGLTTYGQIVAEILPQGFLPTVTPELKHITVGGAIVGVGIESSSYRYGFVHDGLVEADVLLPNGTVVTCTADNEYSDLFHGLPNSYGTLGYILKAKIELIPAKPHVKINHTRFTWVRSYLWAMKKAVRQRRSDFIEGLFYNKSEFYLTETYFVDEVPYLDDIYQDIYYKVAREKSEMFLPTEQYIFRYDPDWFWNIPEVGISQIFRKYAPKSLRNSGVYNRYSTWKRRILSFLPSVGNTKEQLIQDWEVPWDKAATLVKFALNYVDLNDKPWVALPIISPKSSTLYPVRARRTYFNLGSYCLTEKPKEDVDYYYTKIMDNECFRLSGRKMLYSSTFIDKRRFNHLYNGTAYQALKEKYDPNSLTLTLFEKAVENK
ncbi:FAD-binding oxidoreductase [Candidatus Nitrosacidococcus sp. I8]|uniref:FAD-binding oxidoreductase n=1 Tax=Candidatus Nitrosacidococcus sp. I8 TaxID=2942908 RepID=UPI0022276C2B|nr:FAD-binding oxidoreductase [Candidatus Nitrosacidococcus sp. I8]CAH9018569.1 hypothetical protein NURINAE_01001 [Candidatus Nitrosacidococcus sp. I8]